MKKIMQIFPHGVLITSKHLNDQNSSHFTNEAFERDISEIRNKLDELDKLQVEFKKDKGVKAENSQNNLYEFLHEQQSNIDKLGSIIEIDVKLFEKSEYVTNAHTEDDKFERNSEEEVRFSKRSFLIKSLEVEWESSP
jgi:hypothetical protein